MENQKKKSTNSEPQGKLRVKKTSKNSETDSRPPKPPSPPKNGERKPSTPPKNGDCKPASPYGKPPIPNKTDAKPSTPPKGNDAQKTAKNASQKQERRRSTNDKPVLERKASTLDRKSILSREASKISLHSDSTDLNEEQQNEIVKLLECGSSTNDEVGVWQGVDRNDESVRSVLTGRMKTIPPLSSKIVRIFTSSTFTDSTVERNTLMETVYPELKEYCKDKHGLEFQVVDMRWGIRDEATDDHMTTELCLQEIHNCKRVSVGPNFVLFLGHKYGYRPMQRLLPASELELIYQGLPDMDRELLDQWYQRDDNAVPAVYVLRPISSVLTNYSNKRFQSLMKNDQETWWRTFKRINSILRQRTDVLVQEGKMNPERARQYHASVTEKETAEAILKANDAKRSTLAFIRTLKDVDFTKIRKSYKYTDVDDIGRLDENAGTMLAELKDKKLPNALPAENLLRYEIFCGHQRHVTMKDKKEYIDQFCNDFRTKMMEMIDKAVDDQKDLSGAATYRETLQHLNDCRNFSDVFQGRDDIIAQVAKYVKSSSRNPMVLHGESGCGKTSLLAKCASLTASWLTDRTNVIIRFLGTTPDSSTIIPLLNSLCEQLCFLHNQPTEQIPKDLLPLQNHLKSLLDLSTEQNPVVLYLDSLDQLSSQDGAHQLAWLPGELAEHTKIVVSTLPKYYGLLETLKGKIMNADNFVQVSTLGRELSLQALESWLKTANRTLTPQQWSIVKDAISKCDLPLFVRLLFKEVCRWTSYCPLEQTTLGSNIEESISNLLSRIGLTHGETIVSHALGYITASKSGLSEAELEDLLSLDDTVLRDVYQYHVPPIRRIPPLLWTRIRNDLPRYLSEREADGVSVINWFHRQFIDASTARYFKNLNFKFMMHRNLAEYFMGTWAGKPKPFVYTAMQKKLLQDNKDQGESDRLVPSQQLVTYNQDGEVLRYNLRALSELPYHLVKSHNFEDLSTKVLFNYKWLHTKLSCMPLQALMADFELALEVVDDKEIKMLADTLCLGSSVLATIPDMLPAQIVGSLLPYYTRSKKIRSLIDQCDDEGLFDNALVPSYQCFHTPGGPLQYSFEGHTLSCYGIAVTSDDRYLVSVSNRMIIWDLTNGVISRMIEPGIKSVMHCLVLDPKDRYAVALTRGSNELVIFSLLSGESKVLKNPCESTQPLLGLTMVEDHFCVWSNDELCILTVQASLEVQNVLRWTTKKDNPIVHVEMVDSKDIHVIKGREGGHTIEKLNSTQVLEFSSAMVMNVGASKLFATMPDSKEDILMFERTTKGWNFLRTVAKNTDSVYSLTLSCDETLLIATIQTGFKVWEIAGQQKSYTFNYPSNQRNFPQKTYYKSLVTVSKYNRYLVAAVKTKLCVWTFDSTEPVRILEDHFERIVSILSRSSWCSDVILTSSLDKTVKCWNIKNLMESSHPLDRLERPIEQIDVAENTYIAAVVTRTQLGIFDMESGTFRYKLKHSNKSTTVVTRAVITSDASFCISSEEQGEEAYIVLWDLSSGVDIQVVKGFNGIMEMSLTEEETKVVVFSKVAGKNAIQAVSYEIPSMKEVFRFEYSFLPPARIPVLTDNGLYFIALSTTKNNQPALKKFHSKTGILLDSCPLKYQDFKGITDMTAVHGENDQVVLVDNDKGNLFDMQTKQLVKSVPRWDGRSTRCGRFGVHAPGTGGVEMIELEKGTTEKVFLQRTNEGVHETQAMFISNDRHLLYYHAGHKTVKLFNIWGRRRLALDGKCVATYYLSADVKVMTSTVGGGVVVIGTADGRVTALTIADPRQEGGISTVVGRDRLLAIRRRYYEADFVQDNSFQTIVRKDLTDFESVVEEMLRVKNEGTERADTIEEWRQEQIEKIALEKQGAYASKFKKQSKKAEKGEEEGEEEGHEVDVVDGPDELTEGNTSETSPETTPDEGLSSMGTTESSEEDSVSEPAKDETDQAKNFSAESILTEKEVHQTEEEESQGDLDENDTTEEDKSENAMPSSEVHDIVSSLQPVEGAINSWRYAATGVIVNQVAMGDKYEEVSQESENERLQTAPSLGATVRIAAAVGRTRRWRHERNERLSNMTSQNGDQRNQTRNQRPKSVTCSIS